VHSDEVAHKRDAPKRPCRQYTELLGRRRSPTPYVLRNAIGEQIEVSHCRQRRHSDLANISQEEVGSAAIQVRDKDILPPHGHSLVGLAGTIGEASLITAADPGYSGAKRPLIPSDSGHRFRA
jgi:hypothetical protein